MSQGDRVRVVTLNFWGLQPPLDARLALAAEQLRELSPDIIGMQEVRPLDGHSGRNTADHLADELGMTSVYETSVKWDEGDFGVGRPGGQEGLAILAKRAIAEHLVTRLPGARKTEKRILLSACIESDHGPLWFHTTHLHYRLDDGLAREHQVLAIDDAVRAIETDMPQILVGDFNAPPDADEVRFLRGLCTLGGRRTHFQDAFLRVHPKQDGHTWCSENEHTRPLRSLDIDRRIDYVFVTTRKKDGRGTVVSAEVTLDRRNADGHCASDHYGVVAEIQIAPNSAN